MTNYNIAHRLDLQGLRAIAILLVLLAHTDLSVVTGGYIGVDVFFVLSGYLISGLLMREFEQTKRIEFLRFYSKRLKRLLPALILMVCVSSVLAIFLLSASEAREQLASSPYAATWTSNFYFSFRTIDYFNEMASRDLYLHTWSLAVEEQFYLIWPGIILMLFWKRTAKHVGGSVSNKKVLYGLGIVFLISLILSLYWTYNVPQAAFYMMPSRIWQFSMGGIVYILVKQGNIFETYQVPRSSKLSETLLLWSGLILVIGSAIILDENVVYPGFLALAPSFGAGLIILAGSSPSNSKKNLLSHPLLVWIGDRSYSLYLWHWPVFMLGFSLGYHRQIIPTVIMVLVSLLASILSYRVIELPFWKGRWSHFKSVHIILLSVLVMSILVCSLFYTKRQLPDPDNSTDISFQWRFDVPVIYSMPCDAWFNHALIEPCVFGTDEAEKNVIFLGDSIGAQWFSMIPALFTEPVWRTTVLTKSSCAMVDEDYYYARIGEIYQVCSDWRNAVLDELDVLKPDVIFLGSASTYDFNESQWLEGSSRVLERLSMSANRVFIIPGTPSLGFDGPGCVARYLSAEGQAGSTDCSSNDRLKFVEPVTNYLQRAASRYPNVDLLDLNNLVCPAGNCNAMSEDGVVVFRDGQHLTDSFVRSQIPFIREKIESINNFWEFTDGVTQ